MPSTYVDDGTGGHPPTTHLTVTVDESDRDKTGACLATLSLTGLALAVGSTPPGGPLDHTMQFAWDEANARSLYYRPDDVVGNADPSWGGTSPEGDVIEAGPGVLALTKRIPTPTTNTYWLWRASVWVRAQDDSVVLLDGTVADSWYWHVDYFTYPPQPRSTVSGDLNFTVDRNTGMVSAWVRSRTRTTNLPQVVDGLAPWYWRQDDPGNAPFAVTASAETVDVTLTGPPTGAGVVQKVMTPGQHVVIATSTRPSVIYEYFSYVQVPEPPPPPPVLLADHSGSRTAFD